MAKLTLVLRRRDQSTLVWGPIEVTPRGHDGGCSCNDDSMNCLRRGGVGEVLSVGGRFPKINFVRISSSPGGRVPPLARGVEGVDRAKSIAPLPHKLVVVVDIWSSKASRASGGGHSYMN